MRPRVLIGKWLLRLSRFMRMVPVAVMRPRDLIEHGKIYEFSPSTIENWSYEGFVTAGLNEDEIKLIQIIPKEWGRRLLLLFGGGGREALTLAKMGFDVTVVDYVPEKVKRACNWGRKFGYKIDGIVQDISRLDVPENRYDVVACFSGMLAALPTRKWRVKLLKKVHSALVEDGYLICHGLTVKKERSLRSTEFLKKMVAYLTFGNFWYEEGDVIHNGLSFMHFYMSENELTSELSEGGFEIVAGLKDHEEDDFYRLVLKKV